MADITLDDLRKAKGRMLFHMSVDNGAGNLAAYECIEYPRWTWGYTEAGKKRWWKVDGLQVPHGDKAELLRRLNAPPPGDTTNA